MKQGHKSGELPAPYSSSEIRDLYHKYADKLLGYILPHVNNCDRVEDCVVKVFAKISASASSLHTDRTGSTWSRLMALANTEMSVLRAANGGCRSVVDNATYVQTHKYLNRMNDAQRRVFC